MKTIIAEKPSVAKEIARIVGTDNTYDKKESPSYLRKIHHGL